MAHLPSFAAVAVAVSTALLVGSAHSQTVAEQPVAQTEPAPGQGSQGAGAPQAYAFHAQSTLVDQGTFAFTSPYRGANSLDPGSRSRETVDLTLFAGVRLWKGAEFWITPEVDQGFGLSNTLGVAGFPSGEAYKVGKVEPYVQLQRAFLRQTFDLGGKTSSVDPDQMVLGGARTDSRLVLSAGKFSVGDVFDTNTYAHDPRGDFLNWSIIDAGSFDYAANAWGYTYGMAGEWYQGPWTMRLGLFDMSKDPNGERPDDHFTRFQIVAEGERRFELLGRPGSVKVTGYDSRARMGDFADAIRLGDATDTTPNVLSVRRYHGHAGVSFDVQQQVTDDLGVFTRGGWADGHQQSYEFTDIDRTIGAGLSLAGKRWGRGDDTVGLAAVANGISRDFQAYLDAGGLGILVGDGRLPHPGAEKIIETYYDWATSKLLHVTLDYQFIENPAYNRDRGPASILAVRVHVAI